MKLSVAALLGAIALLPAPVLAQELPGCFMIRSDGTPVSLASMCPSAGTTEAAAPSHSPDQAATAYAMAYCDARKDNYPRDVSRNRAINEFMSFGGGPNDGAIDLALQRTEKMCPGL